MNKLLQDYDRITGFGHRVDISELRETAREWPSDVLVDREEIVQKIGRVNELLDEVEEAERASSLPFPSYNNIVTKQETTVKIRESLGTNGFVTVLFNGQVIAQDLDVSGDGETLDLTLTPGANTLSVIALDFPCNGPTPETYRIEFANNLYGKDFHLMTVPIGNSRSWTIGLPLITIDGRDYPESARHLHDYLTNHAAGVGDDGIWTIDRNKAEQEKRRNKSLGIYESTEGKDPLRKISDFDRDEVPLAMVKEGGIGFVRPIPRSDNQGSGSKFGHQTREYGPQKKEIPDGHDVQVQAINIGWSKSIVGTSGNDTLNGFNGVNYMYGLKGIDILRGYGGNDVLFGGEDRDTLYGQDGSDELYGNAGNDVLVGGNGDDTLTGGLGRDRLLGDYTPEGPSRDVFVLQKGLAYRRDDIQEFDLGLDRIGLLRSDFNNLGGFSFKDGTLGPGGEQGVWVQWQSQDMIFIDNVTASQLNTDIFQYL